LKKKNIVRRKIRDSVFTCLFSDTKYVARLYNDLHPECKKVLAEDIEIDTLRTVLINTLYNDLGFIVRGENGEDKLLILVEAQSTWNKHMTFRMLCYVVETYRRYIKREKISIYRNEKVVLPKPELYLIFTGDRKKVADVLSLKDVYWDGDSPLELKINVISEASNKTIQGEYVGFCDVFSEQKKLTNKMDTEFLEKVVDICIEKGYLAEFLSEKKEEVIDLERELFDEDELLEDYIESRIEEERKAKVKAEEAKAKAEKEAKEAKAKAEKEAKEAKAKAEKEAKEAKEASRKKNVERSIKLVKSKALSIEGAAEICEMSIEEFESILNKS